MALDTQVRIIKDKRSKITSFQGGFTWAGNYVDAPIVVDGEEFYKQPMYYAMAHFRWADAVNDQFSVLFMSEQKLKAEVYVGTLQECWRDRKLIENQYKTAHLGEPAACENVSIF